VEVWENQRYYAAFGWHAPALMEWAAWSDSQGKAAPVWMQVKPHSA
jgi:hypothetical protein